MSENLDKKEQQLLECQAKLEALEAEIKAREKKLKESEKKKKQILLRIAPSLWDEIAAWAEEDFRSINGQIEYLLAESVRRRKNK